MLGSLVLFTSSHGTPPGRHGGSWLSEKAATRRSASPGALTGSANRASHSIADSVPSGPARLPRLPRLPTAAGSLTHVGEGRAFKGQQDRSQPARRTAGPEGLPGLQCRQLRQQHQHLPTTAGTAQPAHPRCGSARAAGPTARPPPPVRPSPPPWRWVRAAGAAAAGRAAGSGRRLGRPPLRAEGWLAQRAACRPPVGGLLGVQGRVYYVGVAVEEEARLGVGAAEARKQCGCTSVARLAGPHCLLSSPCTDRLTRPRNQ